MTPLPCVGVPRANRTLSIHVLHSKLLSGQPQSKAEQETPARELVHCH